ncbi:hypothetical protein EV184_12133 [Sinorhizobium americanum]|uniref:Uncharacterized protein n=2 Tax=Sinorhizobium americanum TaxID=194963 RepID=A0A4R2BDF9_9HYPH|nr:hypothetical protein ATC00_11350 [Sinorhizobium americanum]TCN24262.1 hypothetical protein EV184_12133 [Sinorhizobium americanum]
MKVKKKYPRKKHGSVATERFDDGRIVKKRAAPGLSYREEWTHDGCPGTFEAWLASKGVFPKQ